MTQQASYCLWLGYLFRFDNIVLEFMCIFPNMVFYSQEMKFILLKNLKLALGEVGPVEIELCATLLLLLGWYFGSEGLQSPVSQVTGIEWFGNLQINHLIGGGALLPL